MQTVIDGLVVSFGKERLASICLRLVTLSGSAKTHLGGIADAGAQRIRARSWPKRAIKTKARLRAEGVQQTGISHWTFTAWRYVMGRVLRAR